MVKKSKKHEEIQKVFAPEYKVLKKTNVFIDSICEKELKKEFQYLRSEYEKLHKKTIRMTTISDGYHKKLHESNDKIEKKNIELEEAMSKIKILSGLVPICAGCKKIRDDKGYWNQLEEFISNHSDAEFTHGLCPDCAKIIYGDYKEENENLDNDD